MAQASKIYFSRKAEVGPFLEKVVEVYSARLKGRILLKPNLVSHEPYPTTTDPDLFRTLIHLLKPKAELAAGDACAADLARPEVALKDHALLKISREEAVRFYDFYEEEMIEKESGLGDVLRFSALPAQYDLVLSLPVLKTHIILLLTGALKNSIGFLDRKDRIGGHFQGIPRLERSIVGVNQLVRPGLFIVDFRETLLNANELRHGGKRAKGGWILAGEDPVALDWFGFSLLKEIEPRLAGKKPEDLPYLDLAAKKGLGNKEFELFELV